MIGNTYLSLVRSRTDVVVVLWWQDAVEKCVEVCCVNFLQGTPVSMTATVDTGCNSQWRHESMACGRRLYMTLDVLVQLKAQVACPLLFISWAPNLKVRCHESAESRLGHFSEARCCRSRQLACATGNIPAQQHSLTRWLTHATTEQQLPVRHGAAFLNQAHCLYVRPCAKSAGELPLFFTRV